MTASSLVNITSNAAAVSVTGLHVSYASGRGLAALRAKRQVEVIQDLSFEVATGEIFGLAGESGSGKSTVARALTGLVPLSSGRLSLHGKAVDQLDERGWRNVRQQIQLVFQDPFDALTPRFTVFRAVSEPLLAHGIRDRDALRSRVSAALRLAELDPDAFAGRRPHQLSGGERQRVAIARALVLEPTVIVADEPVSMLDVSTSAKILALLRRLADEQNLAVILISHDLSVLGQVCDRVGILYLGRLIETGSAQDVLGAPRHPYARALVSAVPRVKLGVPRQRTQLTGEPPQPSARPTGCPFHPRCPLNDGAACVANAPQLAGENHTCACWHPHVGDGPNDEGHPGADSPEGT